MNVRRFVVWEAVAAIGAAIAGLAGCAAEAGTSAALGGPSPSSEDAGSAEVTQVVECDPDAVEVEGDRRVPFTPCDDAAFAGFFIRHHEMAIEMSRIELERGQREDVKELAARILTQQTEELDLLRRAYLELTGRTDPLVPMDPGMEADLEAMRSMSGNELDEQFLEDMIPHHASGLSPAERARSMVVRDDMRALAASIMHAQAREIGEMIEMRTRDELVHPGAPADVVGVFGDRRLPFVPADDVEFIDFFIMHHMMAIEMAELEVERGVREDVRAIAREIIAVQTAELEVLRRARIELTGTDEPEPMPRDLHMEREIEDLRTLTGVWVDIRFLKSMIPHHGSGLPPAHRGEEHVSREDLRELAHDILVGQSRDIGEMEPILFELLNGMR